MGALLLVLLVMDRRAHDAARAARSRPRRAAEETAQDAESRRSALEQAPGRPAARELRQHERDAERARTQSQIAEVQGETQSVRDQLAQAAERLRAEQDGEAALKQKIDAEHARMEAEQKAILQVRSEETKNAAQSEESRKQREEMTADLAQLERALADLKAAQEKEQKTYSVVPYNGKHGDNRRPLYVECAGDQLIFHPDQLSVPESRIATDAQDEVQRRLAHQKEQLPPSQASAFVPYLMLLVRPDGVVSYYRLRDALRSLKIDFGYEFIDTDWALNFPVDDDAAPAQAWMTAAKPVAAAPSTTPPGAPLAGVKPGYGPAAPAGGNGGPGGSSGNGATGADEPSTVARSTGTVGHGAPGGPTGHGSSGERMGSQFASLKPDANGTPTGPVLAETGNRQAGSGAGSNGPPTPAAPGPGPSGGPPSGAATEQTTTNAASGPSPNGSPGGATTGQGTANAASGGVKNGAAAGLPPVPGPPHGDGAGGIVSATDAPAPGAPDRPARPPPAPNRVRRRFRAPPQRRRRPAPNTRPPPTGPTTIRSCARRLRRCRTPTVRRQGCGLRV